MRYRHALGATALGLALVLAGCGGDDGDGGSTAQPEFNDADVAFAQQMIPHHRQAIEMAELASTRAGADVESLAADIEAAQGPEIETMTGWLKDWGEAVPADMSGMDHDMGGMDHGSMAGMMTSEQLARLEKAKGARFDRAFLTMMIEHHQGAIEMAEAEQESGAYDDAVELAERIATTQRQEIKEMREMLGR